MKRSGLSSDLVFLIFLIVLIPFIWILVGWRPGELIGGNDASLEYLAYKELFDVGGTWWRRLYNPWVFGGTSGHGAFGSPLPYSAFAALGIDPDLALSLSHFFLQVLFSYLILKSGLLISSLLCKAEPAQDLPLPIQLIFAVSIAFAPVFAWRIYFGHQIFLFSLLILPAWLSFILLLKTRTFSWTTYGVAALAWMTSLTTVGQQLSVYSLFFLSPFWVWLIVSQPKLSTKSAGLLALFAISGVLTALGPLAESVHFFLNDASRSLKADPVAFSYLQTNLTDWIEGLNWFYFDSTNLSKIHETNNALGPIALIALGSLFFRPKLLALISFSAFIAICFTIKESFISSFLVNYIPLLGRFRVPIRVELVFGVLFYVFTVSTMAVLYSRIKGDRVHWLTSAALLIPFLILISFLSPIGREILIWTAAGGLSLMVFSLSLDRSRILSNFFSQQAVKDSSALVLLLIPLMSFFAFHQRELRPDQKTKLSEYSRTQKAFLAEQADFPSSSFSRIHFSDLLSPFYANTSMALGVSSLSGYWPPTARFIQLVDRFDPNHLAPTTVQLVPSEQLLLETPLSSLYNITHFLGKGRIKKELTREMGPPWWLPKQITFIDRMEEIEFSDNRKAPRELVYFLRSDLSEAINLSEHCAGTVVSGLSDVQRGPTLLSFQYSSPEICLLVFPINYLSNMSAMTEDQVDVKVLPANGTLVSLLLPPGAKSVVLKINPPILPSMSFWLSCLGLMGFLASGFFASRYFQGRT